MIDGHGPEMQASLPQVAHIASVTEESARVRTLTLDLRLKAAPGQYVMAWLPGVDEKPFSLVGADPVTLTIARVGPFTEAVHRLDVGNAFWVRGPLGRPFTLPEPRIPNPGSRILMIAGGYGVAPLCFLAQRARTAGWEVSVVIGAQMAGDLIFTRRFAALGARVEVTTDDGSAGFRGVATEAAARLLDEGSYEGLYACGPQPMLEAVARLARAHRLPAQLSYEHYMRCGLGICGSCAREGWLVCRDGPVRTILP
jgi:dihydroorotate dehydrogenase electron transfer subunit